MFYLITPVHNELNEIDGLAACVISGSLKPDAWIIVDDNSSDGSSEKLDLLAAENNFIEIVHLQEQAAYMEFHISDVFRSGIAHIKKEIRQSDFIGFLDADIRFGKQYWHKMKQSLENEKKLGIISGALCSEKENGKIYVESFQRIDNPRGGLRLVKGACFLDIGGVKRSRSWDSIMNVQARLKSWSVKMDEQILAYSTRPTDNKHGSQKGEMSRGRREWHLHQPFWQVLTRAVFKSAKGSFKAAWYYLAGYLNERHIKGEQFPDDGVRRYYRVQRGKEWLTAIHCKITGRENPHRILKTREVTEQSILG